MVAISDINVSFNWSHWISQYEDTVDDPPIDYTEMSSGTKKAETDERFSSLASEIQQRTPPRITRPELREIGKWKTGGRRIDHLLKENTPSAIETSTARAFGSGLNDSERVEILEELKGVSVPVASTILTAFDPARFAVIDFRTLRAIARVEPQLTDITNYGDFAEYARWLLNYKKDRDVYNSYIEIVRDISNRVNRSPREVDMALWVFDLANT